MFFKLLKALKAVKPFAPQILELCELLATRDETKAAEFLALQLTEAKRIPEKRRRGG